jgi:hypothetical protein
MIHMIVQWCSVLDKPADQSEYYQAMCRLHGKDTADRYTFEQVIPPLDEIRRSGSDELNQVVDIITNGVAPGRAVR